MAVASRRKEVAVVACLGSVEEAAGAPHPAAHPAHSAHPAARPAHPAHPAASGGERIVEDPGPGVAVPLAKLLQLSLPDCGRLWKKGKKIIN